MRIKMKRILLVLLLVTSTVEASKTGKIKDLSARVVQTQQELSNAQREIQNDRVKISELMTKIEQSDLTLIEQKHEIDLLKIREVELKRIEGELQAKIVEISKESETKGSLSTLVEKLSAIITRFENFDFMSKLSAVTDRLEKFEDNLDAMLK
jgi:chromosome segregation ATPase